MEGQFKRNKSRSLLNHFWRHCFPSALPTLSKIITQDGKRDWKTIEIAARFVIQDKEIMSRKTEYTCPQDLLDYVQSKNPCCLELGGIFPVPGVGEIRSEQRKNKKLLNIVGPLVLDVDINEEYSILRTGVCKCGKNKKVCSTCWKLIFEPSRVVLEFILKKFFGFQKVFFVFSGRKGYHAWVCDDRVWEWNEQQRRVVIERIQNEDINDEFVSCVRNILGDIYYMDDSPLLWKTWFPKLDLGPTCDASHLCKLPLTVHPVTKRITCPIVDSNFDPEIDSPTLEQIDAETMQRFAQQIESSI